MKTLITAALIGAIAGGGVAVAQTANTVAPIAHAMRGDANADGRISRAEFLKQAELRFARLDTDKDGSLTRGERRFGHGARHWGGKGRGFGAMAGQDGAPRVGGMAQLDTDGDGKITRAEYDAQNTARFARIDANGDGTVDKAEMAALPGGGRMAGRIDADGNGALTRAEFDAQAAQRFARMDANGDGVLDATERRGPRAQRSAPAPTGA